MSATHPGNSTSAMNLAIDCKAKVQNEGWDRCMVQQLCAKIRAVNRSLKDNGGGRAPPNMREYQKGLRRYKKAFAAAVNQHPANERWIKKQFYHPCAYKDWAKQRKENPSGRGKNGTFFNPDHIRDAALGGSTSRMDNLRWLNSRVNVTVGPAMKPLDPASHKTVKAPKCCPP